MELRSCPHGVTGYPNSGNTSAVAAKAIIKADGCAGAFASTSDCRRGLPFRCDQPPLGAAASSMRRHAISKYLGFALDADELAGS